MPRSIQRFGAISLLLVLSGCLYSMSAGGGLPKNVKSMAVLPFDNETTSPELASELQQELRKTLASRLGLREAPESRANAIVRGVITRYEADMPIGFSADPSRSTTARRRLAISIDVEIVDQSTGKTLYTKKGLSAEGEYAERGEVEGRRQALQKIVSDIIEGAQSQW